MGDSKALPILGAVLLVLVLPLLIVLTLMMGSAVGLDSAQAACTLSPANGGDESSFAWPTDKHEIEQDAIGRERARLFDGFDAIGGSGNGKARRPEIQPEQPEQFGVILHDQNLLSHKTSDGTRA